MEQQQNKAPRVLRLRSKQEIMDLLQEYEATKKTTNLLNFCKAHGVPHATFYSWQKQMRAGKYAHKGKFIELPSDPVRPVKKVERAALFTSL
ncbi:hypothetical protein, partial [Arcticibacter svalbardensis]|uniref:hypothetical protein n=1 Tax=Arcticibacter svalbardensis TaxID=1288027 RepID=UPI00058FF411